MKLEDVVKEFIQDVEVVGEVHIVKDWPDLYATYQKAKALIDPHFETRQILNDLLEWEASMGGFDSPVWMRARVFRDRLFPTG